MSPGSFWRDPEVVATLLLLALLVPVAILAWRGGRQPDPRAPDRSAETVTTWPHLLRLELLAALACLLLLIWWALALEPPLGPPADPSAVPPRARAPWFFLGVQELLQYGAPWFNGVLLPGALVLGLCLLPYLDHSRGRRVPRLVLGLLALFWLVPTLVAQFGRGDHFRPGPAWVWGGEPGPPAGTLAGAGALLALTLPLLFGLGLGAGVGRGRGLGRGRRVLLGAVAALLLLGLVKALLFWLFDLRFLALPGGGLL